MFDISLYINRTPLLDCPNIPLSLRRRSLRCCSSRAYPEPCPEPRRRAVEGFFAASMAFTSHEKLGSPLFPFRG